MQEQCRNITQGGSRTVELDVEEGAAVLHAYDAGIEALDGDERHQLNRVIAKLKDKIWP